MATKTVIINSDPDWRFRALVWSQALDLFPVSSGVIFRDCVAEAQMHADHRILLGNFPEDFSADPFALNDEMREDVRHLVRTNEDQLHVVVVMCQADFAALATARTGAQSVGLGKPAVAAVDAMRVMMEAVANQTETEHDRAPAITRLWLSLVVRDGGQFFGDRQRADDAVRQFRDTRSPINNVFFLSNGRDLDKGIGAAEQHFAKLRILIDLLRDPEGSNRLKRRSRDGSAVPLALRLHADQDQLAKPTLSAELRKALVAESDSLRGALGAAADADLVEQFRTFEQNLTALLPGLAGEGFTRLQAASALELGVDASLQTAREKSDFEGAKQDARDIAEILEDLRPIRRGRLPQWHSDTRRNRWTKLQAEYEAACNSTKQVYDSVIAQRMEQDRKTGTKNTSDLQALLRDVRIPIGLEGGRSVTTLLDRLRALENETVREIQAAQDSRLALASSIKAEIPARARAFGVLDRAEDQLLRLGTVLSILFTSLIFLVPIIVHFSTRWVRGRSQFNSREAFLEAIGPIGFFGLCTFALSLLAALVLGVILSRQRARVLKDIAARLDQNYGWLKEQYAALLSVAQNRQRLAGLQQTMMTIGAGVPTEVFEAVEELTRQMAQGDDVRGRAEANQPGLVRDAVDAFAAQRGWQERFAAFLMKVTPSAPVELTVSLPVWHDAKAFRTTASLLPIKLELKEPGDDR